MPKANVVKVWRTPIVLGILSAFGLLAALLGEDAWKVLSWMALFIPLVVIGWKSFRRKS